MHSQESGPRGVETRPPSFFPGVCSGGYLFSSGGPTPKPPANFYPVPGFLFEPLMSQCIACLGSFVVHLPNVPEPSQSSFFYDEIYLLQLCLRLDLLVIDCLSMRYPSFFFGTVTSH